MGNMLSLGPDRRAPSPSPGQDSPGVRIVGSAVWALCPALLPAGYETQDKSLFFPEPQFPLQNGDANSTFLQFEGRAQGDNRHQEPGTGPGTEDA